MNTETGPKKQFDISSLKPTQVVALGFAVLIFIGAVLLTLPISSQEGRINFLDALFTSTSAVCVTGLSVVNTASTFSVFGKIVIVLLIQIGGLGIMTVTTIFAIALGRKISLREKLVLQEALNAYNFKDLGSLVLSIFATTLTIEGLGAFTLATHFAHKYEPLKAWGLGIFHTVSAFNNAGFDIFGDSLVDYVADPVVNLVITTLIIVGGIGFPVLLNIFHYRRRRSMSLHNKIVLSVTAALLVFGTVMFLALEFNNPNTLGPLSPVGKILASYFLSVTPRTAGFHTVHPAQLTNASIFLTMVLMFVGASPGGTGGGVKTTTITAILISVLATISNSEDANIFERKLGKELLNRALSIVTIALLWLMIAIMILTITEKMTFAEICFEAVSAFGTVGLSIGDSANLSIIGRIIIIMTMFFGRLGPMTMAVAFSRQAKRKIVGYPEEQIIVG